jgi:phenylpropionate dioxygenase-like ring-hydroxylating dioxygenase large terminal subunit
MTQSFPMNAWYAAARCSELKQELFARRICDKAVVMYRTREGRVSALEDACWHRLVPLSMGRLEGDTVVCAYHGLKYNTQGRCTFMPSQETINPSAGVRSYPTAEKHGFVWLWMGDSALADPALIPDQHWNDDPAWVGDGNYAHIKSDYRLFLDNLLDLTHETFVHSSSIGADAVAETPFDVTHGDRKVTVTRWMGGVEAPPFWMRQLGEEGVRNLGDTKLVDRWQIVHFEAPSVVHIDVGVARMNSGAREGNRSNGVSGQTLVTITPETEKTCHVFWSFVRDYRHDDEELTAWLRAGLGPIFKEDEDIIEAQQRAVDDNPGRAFYNLNIDAGCLWTRRIIDKMIEAENTSPHLQAAE